MQEILVFAAQVATIAVCLSITVVAIAYPFVKAYRLMRGR